MNKLVTVILLTLLSVAYAEAKGLVHHDHPASHTDDYATISGRQYKRVLKHYDENLKEFEESFLARLDTVTINRDFIANSLVKSNEHWDPMVVLNDFTKQCILKYRYRIPTVEYAKTAINKCREDYSKQLAALLEAAVSARNKLSTYITSYYQEVEKCDNSFSKSEANLTKCVTELTNKVNNLVTKNEKEFKVAVEAAECTAKAHIRAAMDCCYNIQVQVHTNIAEVDVLVENCLTHKAECQPCEEFTCSESYNLPGLGSNETIYNPFYGRSDNPKCIMLNFEE